MRSSREVAAIDATTASHDSGTSYRTIVPSTLGERPHLREAVPWSAFREGAGLFPTCRGHGAKAMNGEW